MSASFASLYFLRIMNWHVVALLPIWQVKIFLTMWIFYTLIQTHSNELFFMTKTFYICVFSWFRNDSSVSEYVLVLDLQNVINKLYYLFELLLRIIDINIYNFPLYCLQNYMENLVILNSLYNLLIAALMVLHIKIHINTNAFMCTN